MSTTCSCRRVAPYRLRPVGWSEVPEEQLYLIPEFTVMPHIVFTVRWMRKQREKKECRKARWERDAAQSDGEDFVQPSTASGHEWASKTLDAPTWNEGGLSPGFVVASPELIDLTNSPSPRGNLAKSRKCGW